jgi:hypothetical protein
VADFNPLAATDHADQVRRLLGEELSFGSVSPELGLVLALESDRPEWHFLRNSRLFSTGVLSIAALAARVGQFDLFNPTNSGVIIVVRYAIVSQVVAGSIYSLTLDGGAAGGAAASNLLLDQRYGLAARATGQNFIGNGAVGLSGNEVDRVQAPATLSPLVLEFPLPKRLGIIVAPGRRINMWNNTQNQLMVGLIAGYERRARPEELVV